MIADNLGVPAGGPGIPGTPDIVTPASACPPGPAAAGESTAADTLAGEIDAAAEAFLLAIGGSAEEAHRLVSPPQLRALLVLERSQPVKLGQLAAELGTIPSSASRLCDRLQAAGLVRRQAGEKDRRAIGLVLTAEAAGLLDRLRTRRRARLQAVLGMMPPEGRAALLAGLCQFADAAALVVTAGPAPPGAYREPTGGPGEPLSR